MTEIRMFQFACRRANGTLLMMSALGEDEDEARAEVKRWAAEHGCALLPDKGRELVLQ